MSASTLLILHIGTGSVALLGGAMAFAAPKGQSAHRSAGKLFLGAMAAMGVIAIASALVTTATPARAVLFNGLVAMLVLYLIATGAMTVWRKEGQIGTFEYAAFALTTLIGLAGLGLGWEAATGAEPARRGLDVPSHYFGFAALALLGGAFDLKVILRGGISGRDRIARHLWRMCLALMMTAAAFFIGQVEVFPTWVRQSGVQFTPVIALALCIVFWLARLRFGEWDPDLSTSAASGPAMPQS